MKVAHSASTGRGAPPILVSASLLLAFAAFAPGCRKREEPRSTGVGARSPALEHARVEPAAPAEDDGQWVMPAKNHASTRYSGLDQVNPDNVGQLRVAWTFSTGIPRGHEAAPLVVGETMYLVTPFPNHLHALDLSRPGAPLKWTYRPEPSPAAQGVACCDVVNRGAAYARGRIFFNTLDNHTVAVDAETGEEVWKTKLGDINQGETMTMAPLVVKDKVLVGNSGGELGVRGWLTALHVDTGEIAWRAYSTGPDKEVLIGPSFQPFYDQDRGRDLGVTTWPPDKWKIGGGNVWGWISYDPELDLIYYGTANPGPWNPEQRPGDNKWTAGIFARRPDTGEAIWFYQCRGRGGDRRRGGVGADRRLFRPCPRAAARGGPGLAGARRGSAVHLRDRHGGPRGGPGARRGAGRDPRAPPRGDRGHPR